MFAKLNSTVLTAFGLGVLFLLLQLLPPSSQIGLAFLRGGLEEGQLWRLLTGHFIHFTFYHALMNALGVVLVCWALLNRLRLGVFLVMTVCLPLWISFGIWCFFTEIGQYRGYSATIYGLIAAGLIIEWRHNKTIYSIGLLLLSGKIAYEQWPNYDVNYLMGEIGVPVAIEAHLLGYFGGLVFAGLYLVGLEYKKRAIGRQT